MAVTDIFVAEEFGIDSEFVVVTWLKREGDLVKKDDILVIIQADKVSIEIPSPIDGRLTEILVQQDGIATAQQPLGHLQAVAGDVVNASKEVQSEAVSAEKPPQPPKRNIRASPIAKRLAREHKIDLAEIEGSGKEGRITEKDVQTFIEIKAQPAVAAIQPEVNIVASPVAKRMAKEHGINLADVSGAGERRLSQKDIEAHLEAQRRSVDPAPTAAIASATTATANDQTIPLTGMRATIAKRMHQSLQEMAQLTLHTEADVTELVALRQRLKQEHPITYTDLIMRASALALAQHPRMNARLDGDVIQLLPEINIGMAVALDDGLVVPVIHNVDQKALSILAHERSLIIARARANQLTTGDFSGGTFTVTNLGTYDIDGFTPIINPPEIGILGVGRIVEKVIVHQGKVAQRAMMTLSLSFDHRLIDGAPAAAFLQTIKNHLEQAEELNNV